jgi:hypothetical protein
MTKSQAESLAAKIKSSGLRVGDWIGSWQAEPIGPIESFEIRGKNLYCVINKKSYPAAEVYFCPDPSQYESMVAEFRKRHQDNGEPVRVSANESLDDRERRLAYMRRWKQDRKKMGRARSDRTS